jgi:hypothetical protein
MSNLTIPLISNDAVDLGKKRLLGHELAELFHERPQSSLLHGWNELANAGNPVGTRNVSVA